MGNGWESVGGGNGCLRLREHGSSCRSDRPFLQLSHVAGAQALLGTCGRGPRHPAEGKRPPLTSGFKKAFVLNASFQEYSPPIKGNEKADTPWHPSSPLGSLPVLSAIFIVGQTPDTVLRALPSPVPCALTNVVPGRRSWGPCLPGSKPARHCEVPRLTWEASRERPNAPGFENVAHLYRKRPAES